MLNKMMRSMTTLLVTIVLLACGGGESSSAAPETSALVPAPSQTVTPSTTLADNPLPANTDFNQFNDYLAQLPDKSNLFNSSDIYIKLYMADGSTLFLGRLRTVSTVQIYLPSHIKSVMVDIFSTDPEDQQITEEITL